MWGWLGQLIKPVAAAAAQGMQNRQARKMAEHDLKVAIINNKARLASSEQSHNNTKEMKQLEVASPWVRWVIVGHVMALLDVAVFAPEKAELVYTALGNTPEWIIGLFMAVFGFYFAVTKITDNAASMITAWKGGK